mmetsp:Transcript_3030/g.3357  ORF Transcript_3030/g.3357 Transcript_3030/m.3357 type:complete len:91 (-) Transcript_3030:1235-1507(-)
MISTAPLTTATATATTTTTSYVPLDTLHGIISITRIMQKYAVNKNNNQYSFTSVKSVPTNFVKDVIKNLGYYDSDKRNDGNYYFVPNYSS